MVQVAFVVVLDIIPANKSGQTRPVPRYYLSHARNRYETINHHLISSIIFSTYKIQ